jgi:hypothetical protein
VISVVALRRAVQNAHAVLREHEIEPDEYLHFDEEAEESILETVDDVTPGRSNRERLMLAKAIKAGIMIGLQLAKDVVEEED